jgi:GT2 family glycosyltransferase
MEQIPDISILIVNKNGAAYLHRCLVTLRGAAQGLHVELVFVDAESTDRSRDILREHFPEATLVTCSKDLGYVLANNLGLRSCRGRYTMYLNSDTEMNPVALRQIVEFMASHPEVGAASGAILNPDGSDQGFPRRFPTLMNGIFGRRSTLSRLFPRNPWSRRYIQSRRESTVEPWETEILTAASMVVPTPLLKSLGGFRERFRFYWVDGDLCVRIARLGMKIMCVPRAKIIHYDGEGGSRDTFKKKVKMTITFHRDAYFAYTDYYRYGTFDPRRIVIGALLVMRGAMLLAIIVLQLGRATSATQGHSR